MIAWVAAAALAGEGLLSGGLSVSPTRRGQHAAVRPVARRRAGPEEEQVEGRLPFGFTGGFGLDAGLTEVLSIAAELGLDVETGRWTSVREVTAVSSATTWAGLYLNL